MTPYRIGGGGTTAPTKEAPGSFAKARGVNAWSLDKGMPSICKIDGSPIGSRRSLS
jgi:hypothetical protein